MSIKIKQTTRKFYNKWTYKLSFKIKGIGVLRITSPSNSLLESRGELVHDFATEISKLNPSDYAKRIESSNIDIYTNNSTIFEHLYKKFNPLVRLAFRPHPDLVDSVNGHTVLVKKLPHDRYKFKVFLQPHRIPSEDEKQQYVCWLEKQQPKIHITDNVKEWFHKTHWNWDRRYMYVEDEQMLLMLKLKKPEALGTIYTFAISDK